MPRSWVTRSVNSAILQPGAACDWLESIPLVLKKGIYMSFEPIGTNCSKWEVVEDEKCGKHFHRCDGTPMHLYRITVMVPQVSYVIAEDEHRAISQAIDDPHTDRDKCKAERVDRFQLQGS